MENQLTNNANALPLFFTEEIFLVKDESVKIPLFGNVVAISVPDLVIKNLTDNYDLQAQHLPVSVNKPVESVKNYVPKVEIPLIVAEPKAPKVFKYLGANKKSVLILVNDKQYDVSTEQGRELLRKIVKAVELTTADFAVVNYAHYSGTDFAALHDFFKPVTLLSFGVEIADLKLNLIWQNEIIVYQTTRMIFAPNLHQLDGDLTAKKMLWGNLQKIK